MISISPKNDCRVCLGVHDEQIHLATVRIHNWWRQSLLSLFSEPGHSDQPETDEPGELRIA
jgi:hypothetical protein